MRVVIPREISLHWGARHDLIPLHKWDRVDYGRTGKEMPRGKSPRDLDWTRRAYSADELRAAADAGSNLGIRLGAADLIIDYDPRNDPTGEGLDSLYFELGPSCLDSCPRVNTGGGGIHWYLRKPADILVRGSLPGFPGVEIKSKGSQVVSAGSKHPNGNLYAWDDLSPPPTHTPDAPEILLSLAARPVLGAELAQDHRVITSEQLARLLDDLSAEDFRDHDSWLEIGMACHHATNGDGLEEFIAWSASDELYEDHGESIRARWESWRATPGTPARTIATLIMRVRQAGGDPTWMDLDLLPDDLPEVPEAIAAAEAGEVLGPNTPFDRLSERYCVVPEGSDTFVYREVDGAPKRMRVGAFHNLLANEFYEDDEGERKPISRAWMASSCRRTYEGVEFAPEGGRENWLNTWTGWGVEPDPNASWALLHELIKDVLCDGDAAHCDYVLDWCAHMIQHPQSPAEVALAFRGPKGTGKSTLGRVLYQIAGRHGFALSHGLTNKFNAHLREIVFLQADEAYFAGDKASESQLKTMITEPHVMYEPKGVDATMARNCLHIIMCSNEDWLAPASLDERRFAVFEVQTTRGRAWWDAIYKGIEDGSIARGFMAHLLQRRVAEHPRANIPATKALIDQKLASLPPLDMTWFEILKSGRMPTELPESGGDIPDWGVDSVQVSRDAMQALFKSLSSDRGPGAQRRLATLLGRRLKKWVPNLGHLRATASNGRTRVYRVASLPDCRDRFEKLLGGAVDWDE